MNLLVGLLAAIVSVAQHRPYRHYDVEHGLAGSTVYCVQQDSAGYLWFGTATGLSRFDGTQFRHFTTADGLPGNEVLGLVLDQFGRLWVQTFQGPLCYLKDGVFHTPANDGSLTPVVTAAAALGIIPDPEAGDVKVVGTEGVFAYSGAAVRPIPVVKSNGGTLWLRTVSRTLWYMNAEGLYRQRAGGSSELVLRAGSEELPAIDRVADLGTDVLVHTGSELLRIACSGTDARVAQRRPFAEGLNRAYTDAEGALWITTPSSGAYRFRTNTITTDVAESFAPSSAIPQLIMDREGVLWFASHRDGVFKLSSTQDRCFDLRDGLSSQDLHVVVDAGNGAVLVGTGDGTVERLSVAGGVRSASGPRRAGTRVLRGVRTSTGTFFIGDDGAFLVPTTGVTRHWPLFGACKALAEEPDGNVLVGTAAGLYRASPNTGKVLDARLVHWQQALALPLTTADRIWGIGIGRFPARYDRDAPKGRFPGQISWHAKQREGAFDRDAVKLWALLGRAESAASYGLTQRVEIVPGVRYQLELELRSPTPTVLVAEVCERHLLYDWGCQYGLLRVFPDPSPWHRQTLQLQGPMFQPQPWYAPRLGMFMLTILDAGGEVDVSHVRLRAGDSPDLIRNGDFSGQLAHWFPAAQYHYLPWHVDSLYLELLVERGWTGLVVFLALVLLAMQRLWHAGQASRSMARFLAASLWGVLLVGAFGSVIDAPRIAFLAFLLAFFAIQLPCDREKMPLRAGTFRA